MSRTCTVCAKPLGPRNKSGLCASHNGARRAAMLMRNPETRAKVSRSRKLMFQADPAKKAVAAANLEKARQKRVQPGANIARDRIWERGNAARPKGCEARKRAGRRQSATWYAWCPPELRDTARFLLRHKRMARAEVEAIIAREHAVAMRRWRASIGAPA